ncbi:hypothetical protein [Aurantiacibacter gangjinensis]|uniref:Uncharacterized protein n=1 Tax=Aurantiacibacter gangjinensis TaxID=502682 RepID=A0A0G9MQM9_9SPHN|nr:hypothetical protein [Aurantiacibacter gangjinensis]APE27565.1 hypothetical protein BMF35_a0736 [Aurantiacibacter gangjinensis]KLE31608.1 hypothetical protein AAW01_08650 [Aurantiacibacter gangjinensis]
METVAIYALVALLILLMIAPPLLAAWYGYTSATFNEFPLGSMSFFSFGISAVGLVGDWFADDPSQSFTQRLVWATAVFAGGSLCWLIGFFAGHWRRRNRSVIGTRIRR